VPDSSTSDSAQCQIFIYPNKNPRLSSTISIIMPEKYAEIEARVQLTFRKLFDSQKPNFVAMVREPEAYENHL
ncbi:hypothetical protein L873DRAFT_1812693, partial [Choiromyces venosus 120613-1]